MPVESNLGGQGDNPEARRPTFSDLQQSAEASWQKKAIASYFIPSDPKNSIKWHERFGTQYVRKVVLSTAERLDPQGSRGENYRLDRNIPRLEAVTDFALFQTVSNEILH